MAATVKNEPADPSLPNPLPHSPSKTASELVESEKQEAIAKFTDLRRVFSWPIDRAPTLQKCLASKFLPGGKTKKGKIALPRNFHSELGNDTKVVWANEDLNRVVYNWYSELVAVPRSSNQQNHPGNSDSAGPSYTKHHKWINYVTNDGIQTRRHEYLGPAPRVAGYQLGQDGNIHIQFWDAFLQDAWAGNEDWQIDVIQDSTGKWVEEY